MINVTGMWISLPYLGETEATPFSLERMGQYARQLSFLHGEEKIAFAHKIIDQIPEDQFQSDNTKVFFAALAPFGRELMKSYFNGINEETAAKLIPCSFLNNWRPLLSLAMVNPLPKIVAAVLQTEAADWEYVVKLAEMGKTEILKLFFEAGYKIEVHESKKSPEETLLWKAIRYGHRETVRFLVPHYIEKGLLSKIEPLILASRFCSTGIIQLLVKEFHLEVGSRALHVACREGHIPAVILLREYDADMYALEEGGIDVLDTVIDSFQIEIANLLFELGFDLTKRSETSSPLVRLVKRFLGGLFSGDVAVKRINYQFKILVQNLLSQGASVDELNEENFIQYLTKLLVPLPFDKKKSFDNKLSTFLANIRAADERFISSKLGHIFLHYAIRTGLVETAHELALRNMEATDPLIDKDSVRACWYPLQTALQAYALNLKKVAQLEISDSNDKYESEMLEKIIQNLTDMGALVNGENQRGERIISFFLKVLDLKKPKEGDKLNFSLYKSLDFLIRCGGKIDEGGATPLHYLAYFRCYVSLSFFLKKEHLQEAPIQRELSLGSKKYEKDISNNILTYAARGRCKKTIAEVIDKGASLDFQGLRLFDRFPEDLVIRSLLELLPNVDSETLGLWLQAAKKKTLQNNPDLMTLECFEFLYLTGLGPLFKEVLQKITVSEFHSRMVCLDEKYSEINPDPFLELVFDLHPFHVKEKVEDTLKVPPAPDVNIENLLIFFDQIPDHDLDLRESLSDLLKRKIPEKIPYIATPKPGPELDAFYLKLSQLLQHITFFVSQEGFDSVVRTRIVIELAMASQKCGTRWTMEAKTIYFMLTEKKLVLSFPEQALLILQKLRIEIIEKWSKGNPHLYNYLLRLVGEELRIPGYDTAYDDPIVNPKWPDKEKLLLSFYNYYSPNIIVTCFSDALNSKSPDIPIGPFFDWLKDNMGDEFAHQIFDIDSGKIHRLGLAILLTKLDILFDSKDVIGYLHQIGSVTQIQS